MSDRELYWAVWAAQNVGLTLEEFLVQTREMWIALREEQLATERRSVLS